MTTSEKVAYLKGLAEGLGVDKETKEGRILDAILDILEDVAHDIEDLEENAWELGEAIDQVSDDLSDIEDIVYDLDEDEDDDEDEDECCGCCCEDEDEDDFEEFEPAPRAAVPERRDRSERMDRTGSLYSAPVEPERRSNKVVNIHTTTQLQVVLVKPERFENASEIADHLREKRTVVLNLESTNKEIARRLLDFLSGVAYANEGKIKKVAISTYIITPYNVDILGDLIDELENNGLYF